MSRPDRPTACSTIPAADPGSPRSGSRWARLGGKALKVAPFMALGPITGGLAYGMLSSLRAKRPLMATVYGLGLFETTVLLPHVLMAEIQMLLGGLAG